MNAKRESYAEGKARAREAAIEWSCRADAEPMSYGELLESQRRFEELGRRYGLLREFRENSIC